MRRRCRFTGGRRRATSSTDRQTLEQGRKTMADKQELRTETDTMGAVKVPADRYWGAQTQRSLGNFRIGEERMPREVIHAYGVLKRAAAEINMDLGALEKKTGKTIVRAATEVMKGQAGRPFPAGRLADRIGHAIEHERQRGDFEPGHRADGRRDRLEGPRPSERPCQPQPVVQRHLPDRHAHRRGRPDRDPAAAGAPASARHAGRAAQGLRPGHQDRPDPYPGRRAAHPRPGILGLRPADEIRHRPG